MRIAWLSYLDCHVFGGGGELHQRALIAAGRRRGHVITESPFLRSRPQRLLRRTGLHRGVDVDWDADLFVLTDIRNSPHLRERFPLDTVRRALATGRAVVFQDAWVDVCPFDMPCGGDPSACPPSCDRGFANELYGAARVAAFLSPMQARMVQAVLDVPLPTTVLSRPWIDVEAFRPLGHDRDIDILYVGTIKEDKGYRELVERFGAERLTFAGPNALAEPVAGNYLGPIDYGDLPALYNRARRFAHLPAWYEPMGRTVVEAKLCGCELITNNRVGVLTYPEPDWSDRETVRGNADRFWIDLESALENL